LRGVELARSGRPDAIVLDSILPDLRGTEVCSQLQENRSTATIPIVAMSGRDARRLRADFERFAAVKAFLEKPCPRGALVASIRDLLRSGTSPQREEVGTAQSRGDDPVAAIVAEIERVLDKPPAARRTLLRIIVRKHLHATTR